MYKTPLKYIFIFLLAFAACRKEEEAPLAITNLSAERGLPGDELIISGTGFSNAAIVKFGKDEITGVDAPILSIQPTSIKVKIPDQIIGGDLKVFIIQNGRVVKSNLFFAIKDILLPTEITTDLTLIAERTYLIREIVAVKSPAVLTIQPGVIIKGERNSQGTLVIEQGAKIIAEGTKDSPIVFTSDQDPGPGRDARDWGGLVILGKAPNSKGSNQTLSFLPDKYTHGGNDPNDNSGILKYVRIEFTGRSLINNQPLPALTLASIGKGTTLEYVQVAYAEADGFKIIGGNLEAKYLISQAIKEDDFDLSDGYSGKIQFALAYRNPYLASIGQSSDGIEARNSSASFSNFTYVGGMALLRKVQTIAGNPVNRNTEGNIPANPGQGAGVFIKEGSHLKLYNSALMGTNLAGILLDSTTAFDTTAHPYYQASEINASIAGNAIVGNRFTSLPGNVSGAAEGLGVIARFLPGGRPIFYNTLVTALSSEFDKIASYRMTFFSQANLIAIGANPGNSTSHEIQIRNNVYQPWGVEQILDYERFENPTLLPNTGFLLSGLGNTVLNDSFFENVPFKGAFGTTNWAQGWANFNAKETIY